MDVNTDIVEAATDTVTDNFSFIDQWVQDMSGHALTLGVRVFIDIVLLFIGFRIIKVIRRIVHKSMEKAGADKGVIQFVDSLLKITLTAMLLLSIAIGLGLDAATVMTMIGSVGVAFALALQGSLSNCAGGVLILLQKPFSVGDYIVVESNKLEGNIMEIRLFYTRMRTLDNHIVSIPNGTLANSYISNYSATPVRRMTIKVGISYQADIKKAKMVLQGVLDQDVAVLHDHEKAIFVDELGDSAVILGVRCWFKNEDFLSGKARITEECKEKLDENGIEIPFPQMVVHYPEK